MDKYEFSPERTYNEIESHWRAWAKSVGAEKWVIGISGGKDSTVVAALAARIFGKENVFGVLMPNGVQKDISDSDAVCEALGIPNVVMNIEKPYQGIVESASFVLRYEDEEGLPLSRVALINLAPRIRMATLFAVAQTIGGFVLNTSNLSESTVGWDTLFGDDCGSYAPIQGLTVTEIRQLGDWLGLPHDLVHKTPVDGLQPLSDEEKLGFKYADLDKYIREDIGTADFKAKVNTLYRRNKFKTDIVHLPGPDFDYLGNFVRYNNLADAVDEGKNQEEVEVEEAKPTHIRIDAVVRAPEDAEVNGVEESDDNPTMPFLVKDEERCDWCWKIDIDIATGEVLGWPKDIKAKIHYKVCDCCKVEYGDLKYDGYVPAFLAIDDAGYGDYIILTIEDGKIKNWNKAACRWFIESLRNATEYGA